MSEDVDTIRQTLRALIRDTITVCHKKVAYDINQSNDCYGPRMEHLAKEIDDLEKNLEVTIEKLSNYFSKIR